MDNRSPSGLRKVGRVAAATTIVLAAGSLLAAPTLAAVDADAGADRIASGIEAKKLSGVVGPGYTISINKSTVKAGKYKLTVDDKSAIHNFHITGPGVDEATTVGGTGKTTWTLKLKPGTYTIVCDPHDGSMNTTLKVT